MSSDLAILVENISKCYRTHHERGRPKTFAGAFRGAAAAPFKYLAILRFTVEEDMTLPIKYDGQEGFRDGLWAGILLLNLPWSQAVRHQ